MRLVSFLFSLLVLGCSNQPWKLADIGLAAFLSARFGGLDFIIIICGFALQAGWEERITDDNRIFYVDHSTSSFLFQSQKSLIITTPVTAAASLY